MSFVDATDDLGPTFVVDAGGSGWASLFWQAFRRSRNAMVLLDEQRRHVDVNGAYLQLLGYRRRALVGRPVHDFVDHGPVVTPEQWRELHLIHCAHHLGFLVPRSKTLMP